MPISRNRYHPPGHQFTVVQCEKCGDWYEASYEHICKQVNSYALKIDGCYEVHLVPEKWPKKNPYAERYLGWGEKKNGHK